MPVDPKDPQENQTPEEPPCFLDIPMARPVFANGEVWPTELQPGLERKKPLSAWSACWQLMGMLLVAILASVIGNLLVRPLGITDQRWGQLLAIGISGACCVIFAIAMVLRSGQSIAVLGWQTKQLTLECYLGVITAVMILVSLMVLSLLLFVWDPSVDRSEHARKAIEQNIPPMSLPAMLLIMAIVAIWEETVFRGFLLTRLHAIVKRWWLAVPIGALLFAAGHLYEGGLAMGIITGLGIVLGILFVWRKSLVSCVVCHMVFNIVMMLLMQMALPEAR